MPASVVIIAIYKDVCEAADGEDLLCEREPHNDHDQYAVPVKKKGGIIGHLPRKIGRVCSLPLQRGDKIGCTATGKRQYARYLPPDSPEQSHKMAKWLIVVHWDLEARFLV